MNAGTTRLIAAAAAAAAALAMPIAASAADPAARAYSLNGAGTSLLSYELGLPGSTTSTDIVGVAVGDTLVGVAVRPQTGALYALGINEAADTARLYLVGPKTGFATAVLPAGVQFVDGGGAPIQLSASASYGFAFNPMADRIRVVSGALNFRLNPNTGAGVDGDLGGAGGAFAGVNPDGPINGATTNVDTTGYVNRRQSTSVTTQYTVSAASGELYRQVPPNAGTATAPITLKLGGAVLKPAAVSGLDFLPAVSTASSNQPATGSGYLAIVRDGVTDLATVDLTSGELTVVGKIGSGAAVRGLAILGEEAAGGIPAIALSGTALKRFNTATPATVATQALATGSLAPGETLVGVTRRPQTGQFYGLGINASTDEGSLYLVDPQTGSLTLVGAAGQVKFTTNGVAPVDLPDPAVAGYGVDVNPTVDRVRVVTTTGLNFRVNADTGAPVDGNNGTTTVAGTNPDGAINGLPAGSFGASAAAYTNSYAQPLTGGVTTQYTLDPNANVLSIQTPPNSGTQTAAKTLTLGGASLDFSSKSGFDIASDVAVGTSNTAATGLGYAALTVGGAQRLFTVDLATGAATEKGALSTGAPVESLALGEPTPPLAPVVVQPQPTTPTQTTPNGAQTPPDAKPVISGFRVSPKSFRTGKRPKGASKKVKTGTKISLTLSEDAAVAFTVERAEPGRLAGATCKKQTSKNRKAKKCTRYTGSRQLVVAGKAGKNTIAFSGTFGKKALKLGKYRITAVATDAAKQPSAKATATFQIVR